MPEAGEATTLHAQCGASSFWLSDAGPQRYGSSTTFSVQWFKSGFDKFLDPRHGAFRTKPT